MIVKWIRSRRDIGFMGGVGNEDPELEQVRLK